MRGHFARECRAPRNQGNRNGDAPRKNATLDTSTTNALVVQDGIGSSSSSSSDSEVHTFSNDCLKSYETLQDQQREALNKSNLEIIGYQMGLESLEARIVVHKKNEAVYEEDVAFLKYDVQVKVISIKDLKNQLEKALKEKDDLKLKLEKFKESSKNLTKLINSQISAKDKASIGYDSQMNESEVVHSLFNSRESDVDDNPVNDRFKTGEGFHAVPPPYTGNYMPSRPDLSFVGLDDSVYKTKVSETETSISKTSKDIVEKLKTVRPSAFIIEDWDTNSDNDSMFRPKSDQIKPKLTKINFVIFNENMKSINKENTHSFNHLIKDYDFHDKKMVEKPVLNNKGRVTGQREIRPVWNNAQRVNHQNKLTLPHPKWNFVPIAVATKSGKVPVNAAKQSSPRAAASISTARPVNTVAPKPKFNEKVNTARVNNVTTAGPKAVVSAAKGNGENVVKSSACWIWRPTGNVIDHTSKDSRSYMLKRFDCVDLQGRLKLMVDLLYLEEVLKECVPKKIEDVGAEADPKNLETTMNVSPIPTTRIHKDHPKYQIIRDINSATQTSRMTKISKEHAMVSYIKKQRRTNHKDYQKCLFACFLSQIEPKKVAQALTDPSWIEAMQDELLQFRLQKVWRLVDLPKGMEGLPLLSLA
ncbi:hypothetical protein Tco_1212217 [Tanacetum coccineum]